MVILCVQCCCNTLGNPSARHIALGTEFIDLYLCILCSQAIPICLHPPFHSMFPFPNGFDWNWCKRFWHVLLQGCEAVITIFLEISLYCTPEKFNKVEFAVKFWQKDAQMASCLDDLLYKWLLFLKIWLQVKNVLRTTISSTWFAFYTWPIFFALLALHNEPVLPQTPLSNNLAHSLWLPRKFWVISWKTHWLYDSLTMPNKPPILHICLFATRSHVHLWCQKGIHRICRMALWIIDHDKCLIWWSMSLFKGRYNFFSQLDKIIYWVLWEYLSLRQTCLTKSSPFQYLS